MAESGEWEDINLACAVPVVKSVPVSESSEEFESLGHKSLRRGDFDQACRFFTKAIERNTNNFDLYGYRAEANLALSNVEIALKDADIAIENCVDCVEWKKLKERILEEMKAKEIEADAGVEENDVEELLDLDQYVLTPEERRMLVNAFVPAPHFLNILRNNFLKSADGVELESVFKNSLEKWKEDIGATEVTVLEECCVIWSGTGHPTEQQTQSWRKKDNKLLLNKKYPLSAIIFFQNDRWVAGKSRSFCFEDCTDQMKEQVKWIEEDHAALLTMITPGETGGSIFRCFRTYVNRKYTDMRAVAEKKEENAEHSEAAKLEKPGKSLTKKEVQVPELMKVGIGLQRKPAADEEKNKGKSFRVKALSLSSDGLANVLQEGMPFFTNITLKYKLRIAKKYVAYGIVFGETIFIQNGGARVPGGKLSSASLKSESAPAKDEPVATSSNKVLPLPFGNMKYRSELTIYLREQKSPSDRVTSDEKQDEGSGEGHN